MNHKFLLRYFSICALTILFVLPSKADEVPKGKWTPVEAIHRILRDPRAHSPRISTNDKGDRIATWWGRFGIKTWQHNGDESAAFRLHQFGGRVVAGIDNSGSKLAVWQDDLYSKTPHLSQIRWSQKSSKAVRWTVPKRLDDKSGACKNGHTPRLKMTPSGSALAAWMSFEKITKNEYRVNICSRYYDRKNWKETQPLVSRRGVVNTFTDWAIDINESDSIDIQQRGQAIVAWVTGPTSKSFGRIGAIVYDKTWSKSKALGEKTFKHNMQNVSAQLGQDFAFVSWRQCKTIEPKVEGCEVWVQVYEFAKGRWQEPISISAGLKSESMQPYLAVSGNKAVVAWTQLGRNYAALSAFEEGSWQKPIMFPVGPEDIERKHWRTLSRVKGVALNEKGHVWLIGVGHLKKVHTYETNSKFERYYNSDVYTAWFGQSSLRNLRTWKHHSLLPRLYVQLYGRRPNMSLALSNKGNLAAVWDGEIKKENTAFRGIFTAQFNVSE